MLLNTRADRTLLHSPLNILFTYECRRQEKTMKHRKDMLEEFSENGTFIPLTLLIPETWVSLLVKEQLF